MTIELVRKPATATTGGEIDLSISPQVVPGNKQFSGFFGVGVSPTAPIHIRDSAAVSRILIERSSDGTAGLILGNNVGAGGTDKWWRLGVYASAATQFSLAYVTDGAGSSPTEVLNIKQTGAATFTAQTNTSAVAFGVTAAGSFSTPTSETQYCPYFITNTVPSGGSTSARLQFGGNWGAANVWGWGVDVSSNIILGAYSPATGIVSTEFGRISSVGNWFINTTLSIARLNVVDGGGAAFFQSSGNSSVGPTLTLGYSKPNANWLGTEIYVKFSDGTGTNGQIAWNGVDSVAYQTTSDRRLKTDFKPIIDGLARVRQSNPIGYALINSGHRSEGFVAQEVKEWFPWAVTGNEDGDPLTNPMQVDYGRITPVLAAAIKDLAVITDDHAAEIAQLKARLAKLEGK